MDICIYIYISWKWNHLSAASGYVCVYIYICCVFFSGTWKHLAVAFKGTGPPISKSRGRSCQRTRSRPLPRPSAHSFQPEARPPRSPQSHLKILPQLSIRPISRVFFREPAPPTKRKVVFLLAQEGVPSTKDRPSKLRAGSRNIHV